MVFPAAIRGKSQRWVALSCDAHLVLPVRVEYGSRAPSRLANQVLCEHFFNVHHFARETHIGTTLLDASKCGCRGLRARVSREVREEV